MCKEDSKTIKILSAVFLHSSRIFSVVIFTDSKKLKRAQKKTEIESVMPGILNSCGDFQREKTTKFLAEYISVPKVSLPAYLSFPFICPC